MIHEKYKQKCDAIWTRHDRAFPAISPPKKPSSPKEYNKFFERMKTKFEDDKKCQALHAELIKEFSEALAQEYGLQDHPSKQKVFDFLIENCDTSDDVGNFCFEEVEKLYSTLAELIVSAS